MTKTIKLKNKYIQSAFQFLNGAVLKGKASRGRSQFMKRLEEKSEEYNESVKTIRHDYFKVDEGGELIVNDGEYVWIDKSEEAAFIKEIEDLKEEEIEISFFEHSTKYEALFKVLDEYDRELQGEEAQGYDELMDAYELNEEAK